MSGHEVLHEYILIVLFDREKENVLLRKRTNTSHEGLYDFIGGRLKKGEDGMAFAYRKLHHLFGVFAEDVELLHCMDVRYYSDNRRYEIYTGLLDTDKVISGRDQANKWFDIHTDFNDERQFLVGKKAKMMMDEAIALTKQGKSGHCIGIDGCKEGWVVAYLDGSKLCVERYKDIHEIFKVHAHAEEILIDMVVGLPESIGDIRPDSFARRILVGKSMAILAVPCRQAVYEEDEEEMIRLNKSILDKGLGRQTIAIMPKMREVDEFLVSKPSYIHRIKESHPEVCFSRLKGVTVMSNKSKQDGQEERVEILKEFIDDLSLDVLKALAIKNRCAASEIIDAACLAITANLSTLGETEVIPKIPMQDKHGILMRMTIPRSRGDEQTEEDEFTYDEDDSEEMSS